MFCFSISFFPDFSRALTSLISCQQGTQCTSYTFRGPNILSPPSRSSWGCDRWNVRNNYRNREAFQPHGGIIRSAFCASPSSSVGIKGPSCHSTHPERQMGRDTDMQARCWRFGGVKRRVSCKGNQLDPHLASSLGVTSCSHLCVSETNVPPS